MSIRTYFLILLLLFCFGFTNNPAYAAEKAEPVTLQLIWKNQFQFAGYYVAKELGFYNDVGLDVTIKEYEFGTNVTQDVLSQKAHFGVGRSSLILESMEGKPVYLLSAIFQHSPFVLLAKKRDDLKLVTDLIGKRIMVTDDVVGMASLTAMLVGNGVKHDSYTSQKHTFNIDDLISGKTDAIAAYISNEPYQMEKRGIDYTIFAPKDHGFDFYSDILFTSQELYKDNPELVKRFYQASLRGWAYAFSHIDETVDLILTKYNTQNRSKDALLFEANTLKKLAYDRDTPLGNISKDRLELISQVYLLLGFTNKPLKTDNLFYDPKDTPQIKLTPQEQAWLARHSNIHVGIMNAWPPLNYVDEAGVPRGIGVDYLNAINKRLGGVLNVVPAPFKKSLEAVKSKKLDALMDITPKPDREPFFNFTTPYLTIPQIIVGHKDKPYFSGEKDLYGKTVALERGYYTVKRFKRDHPEIKIREYTNTSDCLDAVYRGEADAYVGNRAVAIYLMEKELITNLRVMGRTSQPPVPLAFGIRKDWPELAEILNKALASLSPQEVRAIHRKWLDIPAPTMSVALTPEERAWLEAHPQIQVGIMNAWPPMDFVDERGTPRGIGVDYIDALNKRLGGRLIIVPGPWKEIYEKVKAKKLDALTGITPKEYRKPYFNFTKSYIKIPHSIVARKDGPYYQNEEDLSGKTIALERGFFLVKTLKENQPETTIKEYDSTSEALEAVAKGEADAYIGNRAVASYTIVMELLNNLQIQGRNQGTFSVNAIGVRKDWPILAKILDRALASVTQEEKKTILGNWVEGKESKKPSIQLTADERAWLNAHPVIRVHNEKEWPPFNYFEYGTPRGLSIDYMNLLAERLGLKIKYVTGPSWNEFLGMMKRKNLDVMLNIVKTEDRMKYLLYTEPYIRNPNVIISSEKHPYETIQELFGKTVAFPKGFFYEEVLTKSFPQIKRLPVEDSLAGLKAVTFGKADAALGEDAVVQTLINKNMLTGLRISGEVDIGNPDLVNLRIGVRDDWPLLQSAIMKAMAGISPQEMNQLRQKWLVELKDEALKTSLADEGISSGRLIVYTVILFIVLSLIAWILIRTIKEENIAASFGSPRFRLFILAGLSIIIIIVCLLGWFTLERNKEKVLASAGESLRMVLNTANDRLNLWVAQKISFMKLFGRDPELLAITQRLLVVPPNRDDLLASEALRDARTFFKNNEEIFANIGFFIINPDHISIGSMRDANIGTQNLISSQRPDLLKRAFQGEVLFVPPIQSDVPLENSPKTDGRGKQDTKLFIGPIRDLKGRIIAVMTLRIDHSKGFSQALQAYGMLKSGETYAFNRYGQLLSESRFNDQLRQIGLIEKGQQSALNIEIRDPGVNMVEGHHPILERSRQPLTHMASRAIQLKSDMEKAGQHQGHSKIEVDTTAYRDYRGVQVFGAWLWSTDLGLGLATEIDADEALSAYYMTRRTVFGVLGFTLFLSVGAILFVLILGERASRALMKARDNLEEKVEERTTELRESENRFRSYFVSVPVGVAVTAPGTGWLDVNEHLCTMLGYTHDELIKKTWSQIRVVDDLALDQKQFKRMLAGKIENYSLDTRFVGKSGNTVYTNLAVACTRSKDGSVSKILLSVIDISERKKAEEVIKESEQQHKAIFENSPLGIVQFNTDGKVVRFNIKTLGLMGATPELLDGFDAGKELRNEDFKQALLTALHGKAATFENWYTSVIGAETRYLHGIFNPIEKGAKSTEVIATFEDITERKKMEEKVRQNMEDLERFSKLAVGREERMIKLKKEINELLRGLGQPDKYKIVD